MSILFCLALSFLLLSQGLRLSSGCNHQWYERVQKNTKGLVSICLIALFFTASANLHAQIRIQYLGKNKSEIARNISRMLQGPGVTIKNLKVERMGSYRQIAEFSNGLENRTPNIGIDQGVVLSTGDTSTLAKTSKDQNGKHYNKKSWDSDLAQLFEGNPKQYDHVIITFELIPLANNLSIDFVFGSDEYEKYVGTKFVDAYGFFISGPGIDGNHSNNGVNVAKLPSKDPVSTNYVNRNRNSDYYIRNPEVRFDEGWNASSYRGNHVALNGWTKVVSSSLPVRINESYKVKLAIADSVDGWYDSSVFIGKFKSERQFKGRLFQHKAGTVDEEKLAEGDDSFSYFQNARVILLNQSGIKVDEARTGPRGEYSFFVKDQESYTVVVDSSTLSKNNSTVPEQSWSSIGGVCSDGSGGSRELANSGYCYGGKTAGVSDYVSDSSFDRAQHIIRIPAGKADAENLNFGFSYDVVTHTSDSGQGSLRQFIENTNNGLESGKMKFIPAEPENNDRGWKITLESDLPSIAREHVELDGTAWHFERPGDRRLTSKPIVKSGYRVGAGGNSMTDFTRLDLEIVGPGTGNAVLAIAASGQIVRNLAVTPSGNGNNGEAIRVSANGTVDISNNILGVSDGQSKKGGASFTVGINTSTNSNVQINHNLITGARQTAINFRGSGGINTNLLLDNATFSSTDDAISIEGNTSDRGRIVTIANNYIDGANGVALEGWRFIYPRQLVITGNTLAGGGRTYNYPAGEGAGLRLQGINDTSGKINVTGNLFKNNNGPGVIISSMSDTYRAKGNLVSQNAFEGNTALPIKIIIDASENPYEANANIGGSPSSDRFPAIDRPVISTIIRDEAINKWVIEGFAFPGATLEFYRKQGNIYRYAFTRHQDGANDKATGTGQYRDPVSNKMVTQRRFRFEELLSKFTNAGEIAVIARDSQGNTSEFSANLGNLTGTISGKVWNDLNRDGKWEEGEPGLVGVTIHLSQSESRKKYPLVKALKTDEAGQVSIDNLLPGDYQLVIPPQQQLAGFKLGSDWKNPVDITIKGGDITEVQFGYVSKESELTLTPNHQKTLMPGTMVNLLHTLITPVAGKVSLTAEWRGDNGHKNTWPVTLRKVDCDTDHDEGNVIPDFLIVQADERVCLQARFFIPAETPYGLRSILDVSVTLTPDKGTEQISKTATDTILISDQYSGQLSLKKRVANISKGESEQTSNTAASGDILQYTIHFSNIGVGTIKELLIRDQTPAFTTLSESVSCPDTSASTADMLGSCKVTTVGKGDNKPGFQGQILWQFTGNLPPGASGEVSYKVKVE